LGEGENITHTGKRQRHSRKKKEKDKRGKKEGLKTPLHDPFEVWARGVGDPALAEEKLGNGDAGGRKSHQTKKNVLLLERYHRKA